mmetsp:Transcript_3072/g.5819  ORF Transcript_3072/g.5819 Transcript_3072/m.5819 type:complete len:235 (+) Transcript_3072:839-1543(+)
MRFDSNDLALWLERFDSTSNSSNQPSTTNRNHNNINFWNILHDLATDCSSSTDDRWIVVSIDVLKFVFFHKCLCKGFTLANMCPFNNHSGTKFPAFVDLGKRCYNRHDDGHRNPKLLPMVCESKSVVTSTCCDYPIERGSLFSHKFENGISSAAFFEGSSKLLKFWLEKDIHPQCFRQEVRFGAIGPSDSSAYGHLGSADVTKDDGNRFEILVLVSLWYSDLLRDLRGRSGSRT